MDLKQHETYVEFAEEQPVIISITANTMQSDKEIYLEAGMNDYLSKPAKPGELVKMPEKWAIEIEIHI
jgi:CheY-like chemotaxis protein